jgi:hypothetical protein
MKKTKVSKCGKVSKCLKCKEGGICDPPIDATAEDLPIWDNPEYSALPRTPHIGEVHMENGEALTDPLDIWSLFFTREIMEGFRHCTNEYVIQYIALNLPRKRKSRLSRWKPMTIEETYIFIAILIHCGYDMKKRFKDHWTVPRYANESESSLRRYMGLVRFELIWKIFTISPNSFDDTRVSLDPYSLKNAREK